MDTEQEIMSATGHSNARATVPDTIEDGSISRSPSLLSRDNASAYDPDTLYGQRRLALTNDRALNARESWQIDTIEPRQASVKKPSSSLARIEQTSRIPRRIGEKGPSPRTSAGFHRESKRSSQRAEAIPSTLASSGKPHPLRNRQKWRPPAEMLPPTPASAYFDIPPAGEDDAGEAPFFSSSPPLSTAPSFMADSFTSERSSRTEAADWAQDTLPADFLTGLHREERGDIEVEEGVRAHSLSSGTDTPGPITPATPTWRPRELTLLKKNSDPPATPGLPRREDKERPLVGLGFRSPVLTQGEDDVRSRRSSRIAARDILPIASTSLSKSPSIHPNSGSGPRELKLASLGGPPNSLRRRSLSRSSSPKLSYFSPTTSSILQTKKSLPVLRSNAAFSPAIHGMTSSPSQLSPSVGRESFLQMTSHPGFVSPLVGDRLAAADKHRGSESRADPFQMGLAIPARNDSATKTTPPLSFTESFATSSASRRRFPPAPLILASSPTSSYSRHSADGREDEHTHVKMSPLPTPHGGAFAERTYDRLLRVSGGQKNDRQPPTPLSALSTQAFHTPMQSPMDLSFAPGRKSQCDFPFDASNTLAELDKGLVSSPALLQYEEKEETEETEETEKETSRVNNPPTTEVTPHNDTLYSAYPSTRSSVTGTEEDSRESDARHSIAVTLPTIPANAFEFDENALNSSMDLSARGSLLKREDAGEEEPNTSESSMDAPMQRPPSPATAVPFNTSIFSIKSEEMPAKGEVQPESRLDGIPPDEVLLSPLRTQAGAEGGSTRRLWPAHINSPLPVADKSSLPSVPSSSDKREGPESMQVRNTAAPPSASAGTNLHAPGSIPLGRLDRPLPPRPKPKPSLVPDVPAFGYTGPISKSSELPSTPLFSPMPAMDEPMVYPEEEDREVMSRWSSGSDSDDDRTAAKTKKSKSQQQQQQRKSAGSLSGQNTKKNSVQSGGLTTPKKPGFFAGLGLRKKSMSNMAASWNASNPATSFFNTLSNSDSPAVGKLDGLNEFPFPTTFAPGPPSQARPSGSSSSRRESGVTMPPPAGVSGSAIGNENSARSTAQSAQGRAGGMPRLSQGSTRKLNPKPSDASIRTTASAATSTTGYGRLPSNSLPSTAASSPMLERRAPAPWDEEGDGQWQGHGLGIQMPAGQNDRSDGIMLRDTYSALQKSLQTSRHESTSMAKRESTKRASWRDSRGPSSAPMPSLNEHEPPRQTQPTAPHQQIRPRKQSLPLDMQEKSLTKAKPSRPVSGPLSPRQVPQSITSSVRSPVASPDETPRIAYASLSNVDYTYFDHPKLKRKVERQGTADDEDGLVAMGEALLQSVSDDAHHHMVEPRKAVPVNKRDQMGSNTYRRPRYVSLSDVGRQWLEENPDVAFGAAQGREMLNDVLSGLQASGGASSTAALSFAEGGYDSDTDDYGSSDGAGGDDGHFGRSDQDGKGGEDEEEDDDKYRKGDKARLRTGEEAEPSSSESDDVYGGSDEDRVLTHSFSRPQASDIMASSSSDDVPLGLMVEDVDRVQKQLRQKDHSATCERRQHEQILPQRRPTRVAVKAEIPACKFHYKLDAKDLTEKLLKVQALRENPMQKTMTPAHSPFPLAAVPAKTGVTKTGLQSSQGSPFSEQVVATKAPIALRTSKLGDGPLAAQRSSPLSPLDGLHHPTGHPSSATGHHESSDGTMITAAETSSSSQGDQREDYRRAVIADYASSIRARSRSRSFGQPFSPLVEAARPPVPPLPIPHRPVVHVVNGEQDTTSSPSDPNSAGPTRGEVGGATGISSPSGELPIARTTKLSSSSAENEGPSRTANYRQQQPVTLSAASKQSSSASAQHRIFLLNRNRSGTAVVSQEARVRDAVHSIMEREPMPADSRSGGWVLYDVCPDLGIERPIREYELLSDVIQLRSNAQSDYFLLKRTELAPYLSIKNLPNTSASLAGWVYVQDNHRKRWSKRWLELRNNCLYVAKTEKGKEEALLCSLSSFDLYLIEAEAIKTPKAHSFALRSQNPIDLFESPEADYVRYFSLSDGGAARHWITAIINARTVVLRQEKNHLFRSIMAPPNIATTPYASGPSTAAALEDHDSIMARQQRSRVPLESSSPSFNAGASAGASTSPLLTFPQQSFVKGSLMEERYAQSNSVSTGIPHIGGGSARQSGPFQQAPPLHHREMTAYERQRREEVQNAERRNKKEGKPLIGIIPEASRLPSSGNRL